MTGGGSQRTQGQKKTNGASWQRNLPGVGWQKACLEKSLKNAVLIKNRRDSERNIKKTWHGFVEGPEQLRSGGQSRMEKTRGGSEKKPSKKKR